MKPIAIKDLSENFFEVIGKEWMLVTAGNKDHFNTMTASWGGIGFEGTWSSIACITKCSGEGDLIWKRFHIPFS